MIINHIKPGLGGTFPDPERNELLIAFIQGLKGNIRIPCKLFQELPFPVFGFSLKLKASFHLLSLLALPVLIVELTVPGLCFLVKICWHNILRSGRGRWLKNEG